MRTRRHSRGLWARWLVTVVLLLLAAPFAGCGQIAKVIPGQGGAETPAPGAATGAAAPALAAPGKAGAGADAQLLQAVVRVESADASRGQRHVFRNGSGVVVDGERRLILTSYAVVFPFHADGTPAYSTIVISTTRTPGEAPTPEFEAELAAADPATDIAVLRVVRDLGAPTLTAGKFNLPAATLGDGRTASAGMALRLAGYPGLNADGSARPQVATVIKGAVTGLRGVAGGGGRTWVKTDARLRYGAAGGGAFNQAGALIGILAQDHYLPTGEVGQVRPLDLALAAIDRARRDAPGTRFQAPLHLTATVPGTTRPLQNDGMWIGRPAFSENALQGQGTRDLFDYETRFAAGRPALHYEYVLEGVPAGIVVEERWFLDDVLQDSLSSSYRWAGGGFAIAGDREAAPGPAGIPRGRWRLEIWAAGALRAQSTAFVDVDPRQPQVSGFADGSAAQPDGSPLSGASAGASQLLVFFDFTGMEGVQQLDWLVFHDNRRVYNSLAVPWTYGDSGRFWVGYAPGTPLGAGKWEIELHADGRVLGVRAVNPS